jgi:hypothetical protein
MTTSNRGAGGGFSVILHRFLAWNVSRFGQSDQLAFAELSKENRNYTARPFFNDPL